MSPSIRGTWEMRTLFQELKTISPTQPVTIFVPMGARALVYAVAARPPEGMSYPVPRGVMTDGDIEIWNQSTNRVVARCPVVSLYDQYLGWPAETDRLVAMLMANFDLNREAKSTYASNVPWPRRGFALPVPLLFDPSSGIQLQRQGGEGPVDLLIEGYYQEYVPGFQ